MKNINYFSIDRNLSPEKQNKILTGYINEIYNFDDFSKLIDFLEINFRIPKKTLNRMLKIFF